MRPVRSWRDVLTLVGFLTPALVLLGGFTIWPAVWAIYQSFTNEEFLRATRAALIDC